MVLTRQDDSKQECHTLWLVLMRLEGNLSKLYKSTIRFKQQRVCDSINPGVYYLDHCAGVVW